MAGLLCIFMVMTAIIGCGGANSAKGSQAANGDAKSAKNSITNAIGSAPVTLKIYQYGLGLTDDDFNNFFVQPVKKKYPNITLELVHSGKGAQPEDLIASGDFPDISFSANPVFNVLKKLGVVSDLNDFVKKNNVDLKQFDPTAIETTKLYGDKGELYALPFSRNYGALFYNKDIFDKFGIDYPKDGMNWEQIVEIARKVSRSSDGVQYRGLEPPDLRKMGQAMSLPHINAKTNKVTINNAGWKKGLEFIRDVYDIPNNLPSAKEFGKTRGNFIHIKDIAMITDWVNGISGQLEKEYKENKGSLNWDVVSYPAFKDKLGTGRNVDIQSLLLSSTSKHKDAAFAVINLLTSEEAQINVTRTGRLAAMNAPQVEKQYAADLESFKGKNIAGIFKTKPAALAPPSDYDQVVYPFLNDATKRVGLNKEDLNTVLRETEDEANKAVQAEIEGRK
jgi:multiple sugar transport system substrate-binding protein